MVAKKYMIALPVPSFLPALGGAEVGLHNIALSFIAKGHRPVVITSYRHAAALKVKGWKLPYEVIAYPPRLLTWYRSRPALGKFLLNLFHGWVQRKYRFDVWHATFGYPVGVAVIDFCLEKNLPHMIRCVGEDIQINEAISYGMRLNSDIDKSIRETLPKAKRLIATTETVIEEYLAVGVDEKQIVQLPNGVDLSRLQTHEKAMDLKKDLGLDEEVFLFVAVGRYHKKKNFEQLISVARELASKSARPFAIAICGTGMAVLKELQQESQVEDLVHLVEASSRNSEEEGVKAPSDEVLDWYHSADCFLMPSIVESFGIVTVEAMACGLPVISADSPGSRDVIRNGQDGLIYDGNDAQLLDRMWLVLKDEDRRQKLKKLALSRARNFDWLNIVDSYIENYEQMREEQKAA